VFRAVPANFCRGLVFLVTAAWYFLAPASDSRAAGCHVPDRSVLASKLSWENELAVDLHTALAVQAPPVLTHPPCQGEVPRSMGWAGGPSAAAPQHWIGIDSPDHCGSIPTGPTTEQPQSFGARLDRPPRLIECSVIFERMD
jgi:hypothetical protein